MLRVRHIRWLTLCSLLSGFIWFADGPGSLAYAQAHGENRLEEKTVLILNVFESNIPAFEKSNRALAATLQSGGIAIKNQFYENLDMRRNNTPEYVKRMADLMRLRYGGRKIDFIVTIYPESLMFLLEQCQSVFPHDVPILAMYLTQGFKLPKTDRRIIPHIVMPDLKRTLEIALNLIPEAKHVYVVSGSYPIDKWLESRAKQDFKAWEGKLVFHYLSDRPLREILATVSDAAPNSIVIITAFGEEASGEAHTTVEVVRLLSPVSAAPVFGMLDILLGNGIVGGSLVSFEHVGDKAGEIVLDILGGDPNAKNIPTVLKTSQLDMFDWPQLKRWHLSESALPAGSIIVNKEVSLWDLRYYAMGALAFIMAQSFLIAGLLWHRRRRRSAEEELKTQLQFETLLYEISTGFINLPAEQIDNAIQDAQARVCQVLDLDLSALWQVSDNDSHFLYLTNVYRRFEGPPIPEKMKADEYFPWCLRELAAGKVIAVSTEAAPPEAARDQEVFRHYGIKSNLAFPLSIGGTSLIGALSFNSIREKRDWPEHLVKELQLLAQVFANAIARKHADHALRESETRLTLATTAAGTGLWIMELETEELWVSDKTRELFHFEMDEKLTYRSFLEQIHPDDREGVKRAVQETLQNGKELNFDWRIILPDGSIRWIVAHGQRYPKTHPTRLMGATKDITQRKEMEESVRKAAREWQATFDSIPHLIMILDRNFKILRCNAAAANLFELPASEIYGRLCHDLMHGKKGVPADCPVQRSLKMKNHQESEIYDAEKKRWYQLSSDPILEGEGQVTRFVHRIKDITERVEVEEKVRRQWDELAHVTRVASMGELTSSLAHEINQPLTAILSNAEAARRFLSMAAPDISEVRQILDDIIRDDKRASDVVQKVRALVKKEKINYEPSDLNRIVQKVVDLLRGELTLKGVSVSTELSPDLRMISGDQVQLQQVLLNLIMNSCAAMRNSPRGHGRIIVKTSMDNGTVKASVTDFGTGIDESAINRLFEPFFTTKPEGLGMGLSISQTIISAHGGTMEASNNRGGGATFAFTLPVHRKDAA